MFQIYLLSNKIHASSYLTELNVGLTAFRDEARIDQFVSSMM